MMGNRRLYIWTRVALLSSSALIAPTLIFNVASAQPLVSPSPSSSAAAATDAPVATINGDAIGEVVVTAQRRTENVEHVPISIQVLGNATLEQHQVVALDDFIKLLPSVSEQSLGPGRSDLFFRGITTGSSGGLPTSGMYFDDIPVQSSGSTLDIHVYDIARVEALSGPQGTLFGASSLAGTLRIITNKPDYKSFSAGYDVQGDKYGSGGSGGLTEGFVNIPLSDRVALRASAYLEHDGGYINNTPGTVTYTFANVYPGQSLTINNASLVKRDFNPLNEYGGRAALGIKLNDSWTFTPQIMAQSQQTNGSFLYDPRLPGMSVHDYSPTSHRDNWYDLSATLEGHVGLFNITYAGGYLSRKIVTDNDYTYYSVAYDKYPGYTYFPDGKGGEINPTQHYSGTIESNKITQELRASLAGSGPFHLTSGAFFQQQNNHSTGNYFVPGLAATGSPLAIYGDDMYVYYDRVTLNDYALFDEASYDLPYGVTLTAGVRGFIADNTAVGFSGVPNSAIAAGCTVPFTAATFGSCTNINTHIYEHGETHKFNLTWQIDRNRMVYATYSTGFRPGGANTLPGVKPYNADTLTNYEVGFKTTWFQRLRWNGAFYHEVWDGLQYYLVEAGNNGLGGTYNAGSAHVDGFETDAQFRIGQLTLSGSGAYNRAKLAQNLCDLGPDKNQLSSCTTASTIAATKGTQLPQQPPFKMSATARYAIPLGRIDGFVQGTVNDQTKATSSISTLNNTLLGDTPGFTTVDFSFGGSLGNKTLEFFIQNATNVDGQLARNAFCAITICSASARIYPVKPQFFGAKFSQKF